MATMNISLPDKMREWIDQQVAAGRYANASDLVRDLIREAICQSDYTAYLQRAVAEAEGRPLIPYNREELWKRVTAAAGKDAAQPSDGVVALAAQK